MVASGQGRGSLQFVIFLLTIGSILVSSWSNISEDVRMKFLKVFWPSSWISTSRESYRPTCRRLSIHGRALVLRLLLLLLMWIWWHFSSIKLCWSWSTVIASRIVVHVVCHEWSIFWRFWNDPFHTHDSADECTKNTSVYLALFQRPLRMSGVLLTCTRCTLKLRAPPTILNKIKHPEHSAKSHLCKAQVKRSRRTKGNEKRYSPFFRERSAFDHPAWPALNVYIAICDEKICVKKTEMNSKRKVWRRRLHFVQSYGRMVEHYS